MEEIIEVKEDEEKVEEERGENVKVNEDGCEDKMCDNGELLSSSMGYDEDPVFQEFSDWKVFL